MVEMAKKNKDRNTYIPISELGNIQKAYAEKLETDPQYSLDVDPTDKYHFSQREKKFIRLYVNFKNVDYAGSLAGFDEDEVTSFFVDPAVQNEIKRLNTAVYHRQFNSKMLNLEEIGGYLTSVITDNCLPNDRVEGKDKLKAAQLLMQINKDKQVMLSEPTYVDTVPLDEQLKDLSINSIKALIDNSYNTEDIDEKNDLIGQIIRNHPELSAEDVLSLKNLTNNELKELLKGDENA